MEFKINDGATITVKSFDLTDNPSMTSYNIFYAGQDLTILPATFTFELFSDSGATMLDTIVSDYSKRVSRDTNLIIRVKKQ